MINEIKKEMLYVLWLCIILAWGLLLCDIGNRMAIWDHQYQIWEYNLNPQEGSGWIDSIVKPN